MFGTTQHCTKFSALHVSVLPCRAVPCRCWFRWGVASSQCRRDVAVAVSSRCRRGVVTVSSRCRRGVVIPVTSYREYVELPITLYAALVVSRSSNHVV
ncbi:unnamed protein product, partial [Brenthis ino]